MRRYVFDNKSRDVEISDRECVDGIASFKKEDSLVHASEISQSWPVDLCELLKERTRRMWFTELDMYEEWKDLSWYVYTIMNSSFVRVLRTKDGRLPGEQDDPRYYCRYAHFQYQSVMYFADLDELMKLLETVSLRHRKYPYSINLASCWVNWTLVLNNKKSRNFFFHPNDARVYTQVKREDSFHTTHRDLETGRDDAFSVQIPRGFIGSDPPDIFPDRKTLFERRILWILFFASISFFCMSFLMIFCIREK